ncbi:MAG: MerR family DNA-binding transcriptional regulator [Hyphomicrobiales bacterium]|nr:MerR family DNA-binding transcriptional regulator [Hyphomicrobiales bacterium]MDE2113686.1 MerR family DNA-binding transcriptional regulator [Hyphomicrobiales bacterium]
MPIAHFKPDHQAFDFENHLADEQASFTIGDLAREFAVSLRALRFYEDRGLLTPQRRGTSRLFSSKDRLRLQMILKGKELGFTLSEISEMLAFEVDDGIAAARLDLKPDQILSQIDHLERQRSDLDRAIRELKATHSQLSAKGMASDPSAHAPR